MKLQYTAQELAVQFAALEQLFGKAVLAIVPLADWLEEPAAARMNTPGKAQGNWCWRADAAAVTPALAKEIRALCARYFRAEA